MRDRFVVLALDYQTPTDVRVDDEGKGIELLCSPDLGQRAVKIANSGKGMITKPMMRCCIIRIEFDCLLKFRDRSHRIEVVKNLYRRARCVCVRKSFVYSQRLFRRSLRFRKTIFGALSSYAGSKSHDWAMAAYACA